MRVVITRAIPDVALDILRPAHDVTVHETGGVASEDELIAWGREAEVLLTMLSDPVTERVFDACTHLRLVTQYAVGYDNIDLEAARKHGVHVTHTPGVLTDATADFAMALLLSVARRVVEADRFVREGRFTRWETQTLLGSDLSGKTMGIIGLGRIGAAVARRAIGFGMDVIYYNRRSANPTLERQTTARRVPLDELLERSDVVSLHCALNDESHHLIDAAALRRMKSSAFLINTARGPVVDETALAAALAGGEVAGAGLDVFEREPEVHERLTELDRVVLAPHLGSATTEARQRMAEMCCEAIQAVTDGAEKIPYRLV